jgi:hypothetical protein
MASFKSPPGVRVKPFVMSNFMGLDSSTDVTAQDNQKEQTLSVCNNAYCDWRGQIIRAPAGKRVVNGGLITHVRFYGNNDDETNVAFAESTDYKISLKSDRGHVAEDVYDKDVAVTSTIFSNRAHFCSRNSYMHVYDGTSFKRNESDAMEILAPAYCCSVQRRLVVAGLLGRDTEVQLTRVDTYDVFADDEDANEENVLRGGKIEIGNLLGTADKITGIAGFEQNRLAIFTRNRTLIYVIDPDINNWELDERANINIGTISHNTIVQAGTDLVFCSERGVHTIMRSRENGILVYASLLSSRVDLTYRALLKQVANKEQVSAVWDQENSQYHIFFPISERVSKRLTVNISQQQDVPEKWSSGDYLNARCGDVLGGRFVLGGYGGIHEIYDIEDDLDTLADVGMEIKTPISWQGSMTEDKAAHSFFLHATGKGDLMVEILNEQDELLDAFNLEIEDDEDAKFPDNPISKQYERKFESIYRGVRVKLTSKGKGLIRILAVGFNVRQK